MSKVIIIEDNINYIKIVEAILKRLKWETVSATSIKTAKPIIEKSGIDDIILSDLRIPGGDADELMEWMRKKGLRNSVVIMTSYFEATFAVKMMRLGAKTFLPKDAAIDMHLREILKEITKEQSMKSIGRTPMPRRKNEVYSKVVDEAKSVAKIGLQVLLVGESGTGKEHMAAIIHNESPRADMPFEKLDADNLDGSFEKASGGTLLIDEIGNLQAETQQKLLRILKTKKYRHSGDGLERTVDVRLVSTTTEDLDKAMEEGRFNRDLLNKIAEYIIKIPPLRETPDDIFPLAESFLCMAREESGCTAKRFNAAARKALQAHGWSGNVTELRNVVYSAAIRCNGEVITERDIVFLPSNTEEEEVICLRKGAIDEKKVRMALERTRGNKRQAAEMLGISRGTFNNLLNKIWDNQ